MHYPFDHNLFTNKAKQNHVLAEYCQTGAFAYFGAQSI